MAREFLEDFFGILVTDRMAAYNDWETANRQVCWAHLRRDFKAISERKGESERIGRALLDETSRMFDHWHRLKAGEIVRSTFRQYMIPVRRLVEDLLLEGMVCDHPKTAGMYAKILKVAEALWTFVKVPGVEPTNNAAEQALRHGVLWRKGRFGTASQEGNRLSERMMTVRATCRQRNPLGFVIQVLTNHICGHDAPSLLPIPEPAEMAQAA